MYRVQAFDREGREIANLQVAGGEITIGREGDRQLVLPSPAVSRRHAKLVLDGAQPYIVDEGSANGVLVNGVKISGPTAVAPGVRVDIAEFRLEFSAGGGAPASAGRPGPAAPSVAAFGSSLRLVADEGPFAGQTFEVPQGQSSVGRAIDNDLVFDDPSLSRKHCRLRHNGDHIELEDLGSSNGTYVNGRKIDRSTARAGDVVRFGEVIFRLEGDQPFSAAPQPQAGGAPGSPGAMDEYAAPPRRGVPPALLYGGVGLAVLLVGLTVALLVFRKKPDATPVVNTAQAQQHLKNGQEKLAAKDFVGAEKEFASALEIDPTLGEARRLKKIAASEPENDEAAKKVKAKARMAASRTEFEAAIKLYGQIPSDSVFHDVTGQTVAKQLVTYGEAQCKAKKYAECGWAICKAYDVVPDNDRATVITDTAAVAMKDAEKKLARDKSYKPCTKH